jgi:hypothetical protein
MERTMAKVAYNRCFGGFSFSREAVLLARELSANPTWGGCVLKGEKWPDGANTANDDYGHIDSDIPRHDPVLVQVIERLGDAANGMCAKLAIAELPSGTAYRIDEYDGRETVETNDSYEWTIAP